MKAAKYVVPMVAVALVIALGGCASMGKGGSDKDKVAKVLADWTTAIQASNLDGIMAFYSEDFKGDRGGKPELRNFLKGVIDQGYLKGAKVDTTKATTEIKKDTASITPIFLSSGAGGVTVQLGLKKEKDKVWRIVSSSNS